MFCVGVQRNVRGILFAEALFQRAQQSMISKPSVCIPTRSWSLRPTRQLPKVDGVQGRHSHRSKWKSPSRSTDVTNTAAALSGAYINNLPSSTVANLEKERAPRLFKRTALRGSKRTQINDPHGSTNLYRADRVLANRTGKSRKECFSLLQEGRIFEVVRNGEAIHNDRATIYLDNVYTNEGYEINEDRNLAADTDTLMENATSSPIDYRASQHLLVPVRGPSAKISMQTELRIDKHLVVPMPPPLLAVYYKPKWVLSVRNDPLGRPCLDDVFVGGNANGAAPMMHPVGRLDYDTTGLLLFSSSGPLTQSLLHPKHEIDKEYIATVTGRVDEEALRIALKTGIPTGEGVHTASLLSVSHMPSNEIDDYLKCIQSELPTAYNTTDLKLRGYMDIFDAQALSIVTLTVSEGKHRMVRRMLANTGHPVVSLHRSRIGNIRLQVDSDQNSNVDTSTPVLRPGQWRVLTPPELRWAQRLRPQQRKLSDVITSDEPLHEDDDDDDTDF